MSEDLSQIVHLTKETIAMSAQEILGTQAEGVIQRVQGAPDTPEGLRAAVESCKEMTKATIGVEGADAIDIICSALLRDMDDAVRASAKKNQPTERDALKARIIRAKLIAATSSLLGQNATRLLSVLQEADPNRDSIREAYGACEELARQTLSAEEAASFSDRCGKIIQQLK